MDNPFPGMDPWMEDQWGDAQHCLITYARDQLRQLLPAALRARVVERGFVDYTVTSQWESSSSRDLIEGSHRSCSQANLSGQIVTAQPLVLEYRAEPICEGFIEITDSQSRDHVVTVIEVVSPLIKRPGEGQDAYLDKRDERRMAGVNIVEIDLLRAGRRVSVAPDILIPPSHRTPYRMSVWRAARPLAVELYRVPLRERLPTIRIPLRPTDRDVVLDLQRLVDEAYRNGTYEDTDYRRDPVPPLEPDDAAWADALLREKGLR